MNERLTVELTPEEFRELVEQAVAAGVKKALAEHGDEAIGVQEAARILGTSPDYVYRHWRIIGGTKPGQRVVFSRRAVLQFRDGGKQ